MGGRRFDVFLSYNREDQAVVERLATFLRDTQVAPWWDRWTLLAGQPWQEGIVEGLRASAACAVMVGPAGLGDWAREELAVAQDLAAKDRSFRLFMVLLPGAPELSDASLAFLRTRTWVDLRSGLSDSDGLEDLACAVKGVPRRRGAVVAADHVCPYRGLEPFGEEHADYFFGREGDVALILEKLRAGRFLAVLGPSGSGKSSLLRAGLLPALRRGALAGSGSWTLRVLSPGPRPLTVLAAQMARLFPEAPVQQTLDGLRHDTRSLDLASAVSLSERPPGDRLVLVVDQLEELFTVGQDEAERASFLANLVYAATIPGGRVLVVVGMRADFYHHCAHHPDLRALVADHQFLVGPLDDEGLRAAIEEPARRAGLEFEAGLVETLLTDVGARTGSLPLLEHVLLELWRRRLGTMLTLEAYVASGGLEGALAQRADATYAALSPTRQATARRVLLRLIQPGEGAEDTRRRAEMAELVTGPEDVADVQAVLGSLADQRLVTTGWEELSSAPVVNITHEALIRGWPQLREWINEDREVLRAQRHLGAAREEWARRGQQDEDLYGGARLAYWAERDQRDLSEGERQFLAASAKREARARSAGRRRVSLAIGGIGLALAVVAVVASAGLITVSRQRDTASSRQLAAESSTALQTNPAEGLRLAVAAYELKPTREAQRALRKAEATPGARVAVHRAPDGLLTPENNNPRFSADGSRLVSASNDGSVKIWDWQTGAQPMERRDNNGPVYSASFSPDGKRVVSAGQDRKIRVWDPSSGGEPALLGAHDDHIYDAAFSSDGTRVVTASEDGSARVLDASGREDHYVVISQGSPAIAAAFSPDGNRVAVAALAGSVLVWDLVSRGQPIELPKSDAVGLSVRFSPDGRHLLSAGTDGAVRVWEWAAGADPILLRNQGGKLNDATFSADGLRIVTAGDDATVRVWSWTTNRQPVVLRGHGRAVFTAAFTTDPNQVVSAGSDGTVRGWDLGGTGEAPTVLPGHEDDVNTAAFSPDGKHVVTASNDGTARVWDPAGGGVPVVLEGHEGFVFAAEFSPDGTRVLSTSVDGTVRVWDWASGNKPVVLGGLSELDLWATFLPDGQRVLIVTKDGALRVWDWAKEGEPIVMPTNQKDPTSGALSPDGKLLAMGFPDGTVRVWDWAADGQPLVLRSDEEATSLDFSPDAALLVAGGIRGTVRVWDRAGGGDPVQLKGHDSPVTSVEFRPDGRQLVSAGLDATVRVWDWPAQGEPTVLSGHENTVFTASFSPDGRRVVSASADRTARVWDCSVCRSIDEVFSSARERLVPHG